MKSIFSIIIKSIIISCIIFNISCYKKPEPEKLSVIEKATDFELINQNGEKISSAQFSEKIKSDELYLHKMYDAKDVSPDR